MSNTTYLQNCLLRMLLEQSIIVSVFLHWFRPIAFRVFLFVVSKNALLIFPNSLFAGFNSLTVGLLLEFSLWPFRVTKLLFSRFISNRFSTSLFFKIGFPSILICFFYVVTCFLVFRVYGVIYHMIVFCFC